MTVKAFACWALLGLGLICSAAEAEPIKLKLAFTTSDRSDLYLYAIKPFVDAVNTEAKGSIRIEVYFSGALGGNGPLDPELVRDGEADIAWIVPSQLQHGFPDDAVLELPGMFQDAREITLVYTGLIHDNALSGYEDFFVIGAFSSGPGYIHSRKRLTSLADLKSMKIGATSPTAATVLERLGSVSHVHPLRQAMDAIGAGSIDGISAPPSVFAAFGIGRVTAHHFLLSIGSARLALLMNRKKFDELPEQAQSIIRKYSGEWIAGRFVSDWQAIEKDELDRIKSNPRRTVTIPSSADIKAAQAVFQSVTDQWTVQSPRNFALLTKVERLLAKIRSNP